MVGIQTRTLTDLRIRAGPGRGRVVHQWELGERPAESLQAALQNQLGALVLCVDAPTGISGAALQIRASILVNRLEPYGRRHYGKRPGDGAT
jgi:hypothetical protein